MDYKKREEIFSKEALSIKDVQELTDLSYDAIGSIFSIHHSSAIYSYNKVDADTKSKVDVRSTVQRLIKEVKT